MNKLLVFAENHVQGGSNRFIIDLINGIGCDYDEVILAGNTGAFYAHDLKRLQLPVTRYDFKFITTYNIDKKINKLPRALSKLLHIFTRALDPLLQLINILLFISQLKKHTPQQAISCNGGYPAAGSCLSFVFAAKLLKLPTALSVVASPMQRSNKFNFYAKTIDACIWSAVDLVLVNSFSIQRELEKFRECPTNKIQVAHNGVEDKPSPAIAKRDDEFVIGCVARMVVAKGVLVLTEAFVEIAKTHPNTVLVMIGEGNVTDDIQQIITKHHLNNRFRIMGHHVCDVYTEMKNMDLFVFPSLYWEGLPYNVIEAMRLGRTIIATKVGGVPEVLTNNLEGIIIEPNSKADIINTINLLITNQNLRIELAKNARTKYEEYLTEQHMHARFRKVFAATFGEER